MPKVTVVSLPEEVLPPPSLPQSKPKLKKIKWNNVIFNKSVIGLKLLIYTSLPLNILAFLLGRVAIMGEMAPFGLALFAATAHIDKKRALAIALYSLAGVISSGNYQQAFVYALSFVLYFKLDHKLSHIHKKLFQIPLFIACLAASSGAIINVITQGNLYSIVLALFNATICLVLSYIFLYGIPVFFKDSTRQVTSETLICVVAMLAVGIAGFGNMTVAGYSMRDIAGGLVIMTLALSGGAGVGAAVGVAVGLVVGLTDNNLQVSISLYSLSGLLAGTFRRLGRFAVILGFTLGSLLIILYFGQAQDLMPLLIQTALAAGLFLVFPAKKLALITSTLMEGDSYEMPAASAALNEARAKINNIAEMFNDLAEAFGSIAVAAKEKSRDDELNRALALIGERVCGSCLNRGDCWENNFYRTYQAMLDIMAKGQKEPLKENNLPLSIKKNCVRKAELSETVNMVVESNRALFFWQKKLADHRQMVTDQMRAAGTIISNLASEIAKEPRSDHELAYELRTKAALLDCRLEHVRVTGTKRTTKVEACKKPCNGNRECKNTVLPLAANLTQEKLVLHAECGNLNKNTKCKLTMQVASRLSVITGVASAAKEPQEICGDTFAVVPLNKGKIALMLSDGMGSGSKAAGESNMAVGFLKKLLAVGFDVDVAVKTVNSLLLIKTPEESFATVDMAIIDTYSGETEFLKVGSAPSYIKRVREVNTIQSSSLPIGIVHQIEIEPIKTVIVSGDILVMVSDGIADVMAGGPRRGNEGESWVPNFLRRIDSSDPQDIADHLLRKAIELSGGRLRDDMTVLVAKVLQQPVTH